MIAVVILTHNEELHIARAIQSVRSFAAEIFVIDAFSTDRTIEIAQSLGAVVLSHHWVNYAQQFQWAVDHAPISSDWIMRLDADEVIEPDLAETIRLQLPTLPAAVTGITLARKHIFMDRWIRHGGRYPLTLLRLFRRGCGRIEQRWMDEHIVVESGRIVHFSGGFADHNLKDLSFFIDKHNGYASREALDVLNQRHDLFTRDGSLSAGSSARQAGLRRLIKERIYNRIPFLLSSLGYFLFRYIFQLGFLDGREGVIYHGLQAFWYRFLVGAKVLELERAIADMPNREARLRRLAELTGLKLESPAEPSGQGGESCDV
jgi:glycosyltransferase involved in cell wall biosynthesis